MKQDPEGGFLALGAYFFFRPAFFFVALFFAVFVIAFFFAISKPPCN